MTLKTFASRLIRDEEGAVSVDWVVLCAAVVALAVATAGAMEGQLSAEANKMGSRISTGVGG